MNTKLHLLVAGMFLAALGTGYGQPIITVQPTDLAVALGGHRRTTQRLR